MRAAGAIACGILVLAIGLAASACDRPKYGQPLELDAEWRNAFAKAFDLAEAVYLVQATSAGPLNDGPWRLACDTEESYPPPLGRRRDGETRSQADYKAELRAAEAESTACTAEAVRFDVQEVVKGPAISSWIDADHLLTIVTASPSEPARKGEPAAYYHSVYPLLFNGMCGIGPARRLVVGQPYLVFMHPSYRSSESEAARPPWLSDAYWADPSTPFLSEARKLADTERRP